jgi:hypothetical protein
MFLTLVIIHACQRSWSARRVPSRFLANSQSFYITTASAGRHFLQNPHKHKLNAMGCTSSKDAKGQVRPGVEVPAPSAPGRFAYHMYSQFSGINGILRSPRPRMLCKQACQVAKMASQVSCASTLKHFFPQLPSWPSTCCWARLQTGSI